MSTLTPNFDYEEMLLQAIIISETDVIISPNK